MAQTMSPKNHTTQNMLSRAQSGFSVVELLVSLAIVIVVTSITLASFPSFSSQLVLNNLAHEVALTVREAQVFGVGTRAFEGGFPSHGIHFDINTPDQFVLFADIDEDGEYDGTFDCEAIGSAECVSVFSLRRNNEIDELCVTSDSGQTCRAGGIEQVDITYVRPDPEAVIYNDGNTTNARNQATIMIVSPSGRKKPVIIHSNGQIAVGETILPD